MKPIVSKWNPPHIEEEIGDSYPDLNYTTPTLEISARKSIRSYIMSSSKSKNRAKKYNHFLNLQILVTKDDWQKRRQNTNS